VVVSVSKKDINAQLIERINEVIQEHSNSGFPTDRDFDDLTYYYFLSRFESVIDFLPKKDNSYKVSLNQAKQINYSGVNGSPRIKRIRLNAISGILKALKEDVSRGYLVSVSELIHADLFADFTEMAEHLLEEGYKDPAAVILGSVLEEHLRKLCIKNSLPIDAPDSKGVTKPKKADRLNTELTAARVYEKLDQKSVTAWLDLRNKAAHGQYSDYLKPQVELLLQSVRDFITRHPA
jgi:hypothetical protein